MIKMSELNLNGMSAEDIQARIAELEAGLAAKVAEAEAAAKAALAESVGTYVSAFGDLVAEMRKANKAGDFDATVKAIGELAESSRDAMRAIREATKGSAPKGPRATPVRNGELRDKVRTWLDEHAGSHGVSAITTDLVNSGIHPNASSGSVGNALERLVAMGEADRTSKDGEAKRFSRDGYSVSAEA